MYCNHATTRCCKMWSLFNGMYTNITSAIYEIKKGAYHAINVNILLIYNFSNIGSKWGEDNSKIVKLLSKREQKHV